ncbi:MAG: hypothetical protein GX774_16685 [Armatimonadetes bacterium]|jgi:hypothetical protein|nr:hypothetical protein [Armatimonadota bacterium]
MRALAWTGFLVACLAQGPGAKGAAMENGRVIRLDSGKVSLDFQATEGRLALTRLADSDGPEWIGAPAPEARLWTLAFEGPEGAAREVTSSQAVLAGARKRGERVTFTWRVPLEAETATVTVGVRCPAGSALSHWSLAATLPEGWKVARADFPVLSGIRLEAAPKLAAPMGWGLEYDLKPGVEYGGTYPSCAAAMPFAVFYGAGQALYVGAHDPRGGHKHLWAGADAAGAGFRCSDWPALPPNGGGTYRVPYDVVIGSVPGGYFEAAQIYRQFSFQTRWGKGGPVSRRSIPQWLKETDLWLMPAAEPGKNVADCQRAGEFFGVPTALHWYNWHQIPFDTLYPDYFPTKLGFVEGVKALQAAGFRVMPYINGRLADTNSRFWAEREGEHAAARQPGGQLYTEVYGSKVPLQVMCPYTETWQTEVVSLVDRLVNECGVDGVYIDQIGAAAPVRCLNAAHGHPLGGGHWWADGYRKLLDRARKKLPKGRMLTTEENGECWIDQLDALLLVNTSTTPAARPIPLFPTVYTGRTITFGFQYIAGDDLKRSLPFRAKMARAFLWGSQLGWVGIGAVMAPEAVREAEYLRSLARCRRFVHPYLAEGRFLGMQEATGDNPRLRGEGSGSFGGTYPIDLPAVMASNWLAEDGSVAVALTNLSDEPHEVTVTRPQAPEVEAKLAVQLFGPDGPLPGERRGAVQRVTVAPRSALVVAWR